MIESTTEMCKYLVSKLKGGIDMIIGYCRVSTKGQLDGNSIEEQNLPTVEYNCYPQTVPQAVSYIRTNI